MALITSGFGGDDTPPKPLQKGGPVKRYTTVINGVETTLLLSDEDAKARGLKADSAEKSKEAKAPANKGGSAAADKRAEAVSRAMNKPSKSGDA